jgi:hypothetical protein
MTSFLDRYAALIERIPVPERSGFKGAVLAVAFLFAMVEGFDSAAGYCAIHPTSHWCEKSPDEGTVSVRWRLIMRVYLGEGMRPRECTCHLDWRNEKDSPGWIAHDSDIGIACGSVRDIGIATDKWLAPEDVDGVGPWHFDVFIHVMGEEIHNYEVRLHCSDDPQYAPNYVEVPYTGGAPE